MNDASPSGAAAPRQASPSAESARPSATHVRYAGGALGERDSTANRNAPSGAILSAIASGHASGTTRCASMTMYSAPAAAATTIGRVA